MAERTSTKISRRDAMKILAAAAGATALANIPDRWTRPDMEVGVLPAHAQTSPGLYTITAGASEPDANYCFPLISTATISPPTFGIELRYTITPSPAGLSILSPTPLSGTLFTDSSGNGELIIDVDEPFDVSDTVTVNWSFENPSDGAGSGIQIFTSGGSGC